MRLTHDSKRLTKKANEVEDILGCKTVKTIKQLLEAYQGLQKTQGLAAPQIGVSERIIICRIKKRPIVMINPVITCSYGKKESNEGCESVVGRYIMIRPRLGKVKYYNEQGEMVQKWYRFRWLRVICHEIDHLDGICINEKGIRWN